METSKITSHTRSISLPSRSHPLEASIEYQLSRLQSSKEASSSGSLVCQNLSGIKDLYKEINSLIQLSRNQISLSNEIECVVEGSLVLLDVFGTTMDLLSQIKDCISDLSSSLRRRCNSSTAAYMTSRKKINKMVSKSLVENLKKADKSLEKDGSNNTTSPTVRNLREAEAICLSTLKSVLAYVSGSTLSSKGLGWSKVVKLMKTSRHVSCDTNDPNVFEKIDGLLDTSKKSSTDVKSSLKQLKTVEMEINEIQDTLESVSKCLVKTRVSLLNVVSQ